MTFLEMLCDVGRRNRSLLCIGLDPDPARIPAGARAAPDPIYAFCAAVIDATADLVCAFKPNSAFFEAAFEVLGAHAITLNPYLGGDALAPFLRYADKGCLLVCKTSNPGGAELQDLRLADGHPLYLEVARRAQTVWNEHGNVGLVVGATHADVLPAVRAVCPDLPLLVPGVGAQGGDLTMAVLGAVDRRGERAIINASRSVLYAAEGTDFADAARREALRLREEINVALKPGV